MNRRKFIKNSSTVITSSILLNSTLMAMNKGDEKMSKKPNILIILPDQLRKQALSCYGDKNINTTNIDEYAKNGVRFANASSSFPVCVPFRYSFMTGRCAHYDNVPAIHYEMPVEEKTLADEFNDAGYETIYVGKWHIAGTKMQKGADLSYVPPKNQGRWSKWYGFEVSNVFDKTRFFEDDNTEPTVIDEYQTDGLFNVGIKHLAERRDKNKPFCMVLSVEPPHDSRPSKEFYAKYPAHKKYPNKHDYYVPEKYASKWKNKNLVVPPNFTLNDKTKDEYEYFLQGRRNYYGMIENLDDNVGRLKKFLKINNLDKNTIIVLFSDHGELGGRDNTNGGHKCWPYEESAGIPLIVYDPRTANIAGKVIEDPINTEDLYPTLIGLANITTTKNLTGENCSPLIYGEKNELNRNGVMLEYVRETRRVFYFYNKSWRGFRSKDYKYLVKKEKKDEFSQPWQFFDLKNDPYEINNLIDNPKYKKDIAQHHKWLTEEIKRTKDFFVL